MRCAKGRLQAKAHAGSGRASGIPVSGTWVAFGFRTAERHSGFLTAERHLDRNVRSWPVSRVLSLKTTIYLGRQSPGASSTQPERTGEQPYGVPICACSGWGLPSHAVTRMLVRSYRTVSAFPHGITSRGSFLFCGTNPSGCPAQPLAGILPAGARTFLVAHARTAVARPAPRGYSTTMHTMHLLQAS